MNHEPRFNFLVKTPFTLLYFYFLFIFTNSNDTQNTYIFCYHLFPHLILISDLITTLEGMKIDF
jgi:hypothetical protein